MHTLTWSRINGSGSSATPAELHIRHLIQDCKLRVLKNWIVINLMTIILGVLAFFDDSIVELLFIAINGNASRKTFEVI